MTNQFIETEEHGRVLVLRLNDPTTRNALGGELTKELLEEIARFERSQELRCLILTGADPSFCSGANVRGFAQSIERREQDQDNEEPPPLPWAALNATASHRATEPDSDINRFLPMVMMRLQKPSIAAVNGYALGLGNGLALSCDIRIASEKAVFAENFISRGLIPGDGSCWQLPRMIGLSNTYLMQYTGDRFDAETALKWGMVSKVVSHEQLMEATLELATRLAEGPVYTMGMVKYLILQSGSQGFEESLRQARAANAIARTTFDHKEGVQAFIEKRTPRFEGR